VEHLAPFNHQVTTQINLIYIVRPSPIIFLENKKSFNSAKSTLALCSRVGFGARMGAGEKDQQS
jgi:hypothetical protein